MQVSKIVVVGYGSCPFTQEARSQLIRISAQSDVEVETIIKPPAEYRKWVRENAHAKAASHTTSPACFVGGPEGKGSSFIGGSSDLKKFAVKHKLVAPGTSWSACGIVIALIVAVVLGPATLQWQQYESTKLAPFGGGYVKDMAAFALTTSPKIARTLLMKPDPTDAELEGWHDTIQFNNFGTTKRFKDSKHFAENFYFWANERNSANFLYTIRLSFFGVNASTVITWFHFMHNGEAWDLPEEWENKTLPHKTGDPRQAIAPGLGELHIDCLIPMKHWKIKYKGVVRNMKNPSIRKQVVAEFDLYFSPNNVFKYQLHWDPLTAARAMAGKPWTPEFFRDLTAQNQERYASQAKEVNGFYQFEGENKVVLEHLDGSRDHNFGIRNWRFIHTYIWFPPVKFIEPLEVDGVMYEYLTGAMTMYGSTFDNMVVGGLVSANGRVSSWSGATPMRDIAPEWYDATSHLYGSVGDETLKHGVFEWSLGIEHSKYILEMTLTRGPVSGLWTHKFMLGDGSFEIHEGQTWWDFRLKKAGSDEVIRTAKAIGLFEFGKNLVGFDDSE